MLAFCRERGVSVGMWGHMTSVFMPFAVQHTHHFCRKPFLPAALLSLQLPTGLLCSMVHWWHISPQSQALVKTVPLWLPSSFPLWFTPPSCHHMPYQRWKNQSCPDSALFYPLALILFFTFFFFLDTLLSSALQQQEVFFVWFSSKGKKSISLMSQRSQTRGTFATVLTIGTQLG